MGLSVTQGSAYVLGLLIERWWVMVPLRQTRTLAYPTDDAGGG